MSLRTETDTYEAMLWRQGQQYASGPDKEVLWVYSMGKRFQVRHISTTVELANEFMEKHPDTALIACYGPFNIIANVYEGVRP